MSKANSAASTSSGLTSQAWSWTITVWIAAMILLGGVSTPRSIVLWIVTMSSLIVLFLSLLKLRNGFPTGLSVAGAILAALSMGLLFLQLVPLPYGVWSSFPGRALFVEVVDATALEKASRPLSLNPSATYLTILAFIPALAGFFAALTMSFRDLHRVFAAVLLCAFVSLIIGLMQRFYGEASGLYFYGREGGVSLGTFINRNHFATQLYCAIPFLAAFAMYWNQESISHPVVTLGFAIIFSACLITGLAATGSRAGIVFAMLAAFLSALFVFRGPAKKSGQRRFGLSLLVTLGGLLIAAQASLVGILRVASTDHLADYRSVIFGIGLDTFKTYFPVGSGFGTFVPVYEIHEKSGVIITNYVNHAHNDWLELAIEGGLPAIALLVGFVVLLAACAIKIVRRREQDLKGGYLKAALVVILLMLAHSIVDFPLRMVALLVLFSFCCGLVCLAAQAPPKWQATKPSSSKAPQPKREFKPFTRPERGFGAPKMEKST